MNVSKVNLFSNRSCFQSPGKKAEQNEQSYSRGHDSWVAMNFFVFHQKHY